jgi:hypothetical protein
MKKILSLIFLFVSTASFSQNWECIKTNGDYYYASRDYNHTVKLISIDSSSSVANDSIYYLPKTIRNKYPCYNPNMPSWLGKYIIKSSDSLYYFFNENNDTIKIKHHSNLNESWTCFARGNNFFVTAKVDSIKYLSFIGYTDSVKVISFLEHDSLGATISAYINSFKIYISKFHGLIKIIPFWAFPDYSSWGEYYTEALTEYYIIGKTDTLNGLTNINYHDVYNFNVGDEYYVGATSGDGFPLSPYYEYRSYCLTKILGKTVHTDGDSIVYEIEKCCYNFYSDFDTSYSSFSSFTGSWTVNFNSMNNEQFDLAPDEVYYDPDYNSIYTLPANIYNNKYYSKTIPSFDYYCDYQNDSCWGLAVWDACLSPRTYIAGLEGPYGGCSYYSAYENRGLIYYKKGSDIYGTAVTCSTIEHLDIEDIKAETFHVSVSPNPFSDNAYVKINSDNVQMYTFEIYNVFGQRLRKIENINSKDFLLERENLSSGMYYFSVTTDEHSYSGKFIVE